MKILVATHKKYQMPKDNAYFPIHVGREGKKDLGYHGDNLDDNISYKNANYCELTALYWAWKNMQEDFIGLAHYRRYLTGQGFLQALFAREKNKLIMSEEEARDLLKEYDVLLPRKRNYFIESVESHYIHAHNKRDLETTRDVISERHPEYIDSFNQVLNGKSIHLYNMFVMSKEQLDRYCEWLFDILFEIENRIDISDYDNYQKRVYGFLSERLFNVWITKENLKLKELDTVNLDNINYRKKCLDFIKRKLRGGK